MTDISDFYTRENAGNGLKAPLVTPSGESTEHYLMIRGVDSDEFKRAEAEANRSMLLAAEMEGDKRFELQRATTLKLLSSLVCGWSFDKEFNENNVIELLTEAPQIAKVVDVIATDRSLFVKKKSTNSKRSRKNK